MSYLHRSSAPALLVAVALCHLPAAASAQRTRRARQRVDARVDAAQGSDAGGGSSRDSGPATDALEHAASASTPADGSAGTPASLPTRPPSITQPGRSAEQRAAQALERSARAAAAAAEHARAIALAEQQRARTEAARLIAGARAELERVRTVQARYEQQTARARQELVALRHELEQFRGLVAARESELLSRRPTERGQVDGLYDRVVEQLIRIRPRALRDLWRTIRGVQHAPEPEGLPAALYRLADEDTSVVALDRLRGSLDRRADTLTAERSRVVRERLALLQREVTWLNDHRTALFPHLSRGKREDLVGLSRTTLGQLMREVSQLGFDAVYWSTVRLRQLDELPRLLIDVFMVGNLLWRALKVLLLFVLLRHLLRRWRDWLGLAIQRISRSPELGRHAKRLAKLADVLRHAGPSMLVLLVVSAVFRVVTGNQGFVEAQVVYIVVFWLCIYRVQLRLVETAAKHAGMEKALRAAEGESWLDLDDDLEGPPAPNAMRAAQPVPGPRDPVRIVPAPVLVARSLRAATRYILIVVLILELTAIAVGKGTIYGLTVKFSWWASLPFIVYFLKLWRPHIIGAYQVLGAHTRSGTLGQLVTRSERRFYSVFIVAAAFAVVLADRAATFARRYLSSRAATKKLLAFLFRRRVERYAEQAGRVVVRRQDLPDDLLAQFPMGPIGFDQGAFSPPVLEQVKALFDTWRDERADGSMALVGAAGMGKSTVLRLLGDVLQGSVICGRAQGKLVRANQVVSWLADVLGLSPRPTSDRELVRALREQNRPLVALDDCHNLYLRRVGGFEGWDAFVRIVNETCDRTFWLVNFNQSAWDYLFNAAGRVHYFRRVVRITPWSERRIQRLLMHRTRKAGYRTSFSDLVAAQMSDIDFAAEAGRTSAGYFRMLWDFTGGNPRLASHFWLDSLVPESGKREVRVNLFKEPAIAELDALTPDIAFVLTAIAAHENLTASEAARTTGLSLDFCRFALRACHESSYLERAEGGRFRLSTRWQRPVIRYLRRKRLLHDD